MVGSEQRRKESPPEPRPGSLGDLLYNHAAHVGTPEAEWRDLVRSVAAGDPHALRALFERTHRIVYTLSVRITGSRETAEEVTLDVFHDVWRRASEFDPSGGPVVGWIMNQARSRAIDRLRFEQRLKRSGHSAELPPGLATQREPNEGLDQDQAGLLREALAQLTVTERDAIETAFFSELSYAETALRLNQPLGTIKTRIRSGLEKLRQSLQTLVRER